MNERGLDAVLLHTRANFAWVTGGKDNHIVQASEYGVADLVVFDHRVVCVTPRMERRRIAEEELSGTSIEVLDEDWMKGTGGLLSGLLRGQRVGCDTPGFLVDGAEVVSVVDHLSKLRMVLNANQVAQYRDVCARAADALESVARTIEPGQTEFEVAAQLMAEVQRRECMPNVALVSSDERLYRYRHPIPTGKRIDKHVMMVVCAEKYGLIANCTRFVHFGALAAELADAQQACAYLDVRVNAATRPGRRVGDVVQTLLDSYHEVGRGDDWQWLHLGGPTGYAGREYLGTPWIDDLVQANTAYAWNPAIYGAKSEDTVLVGESDNEFMTAIGNWPTVAIEWEGRTYHRPAILVR